MSVFQRVTYPFTAIVGQEKMKKGLILNAINPRLGGIIIRGQKGTAKSTAVRALAALLPEIEVVVGCPFNCDPNDLARLCSGCRERLAAGRKLERTSRRVQVIDLPVSATEDRVVGSLDFEYAIKHGRPRFEPGVLARANRGIIYVDEVNLLDDHIVDVLLDAAAMGVNVVEREGISYSHPAEFVLVGTMNPEEGELRPQLLDRFGLCVQIEGVDDPEQRVEIIRRREAFDADPMGFLACWAPEEQRLREKIIAARAMLPRVTIPENLLHLAARLSMEALAAGHRADIVMAAAARTIAAFDGRIEVTENDILEAAELVLPHRAREAPPPPQEQPEPPQEEPEPPQEEDHQEQNPEQSEEAPAGESFEDSRSAEQQESRDQEPSTQDHEPDQASAPPAVAQDVVFAVGQPFPVRRITYDRDRLLRKGSGRRSRTRTATRAGRYVRSTMQRKNNDLAFDATLRAAAPYQVYREKNGLAVALTPADIREKVREKRIGNFLLFVVDASGSMGAQQRMVETKGAILSLLMDAYQKRDKIGLVAFKGDTAEVLLPPTGSVEMGYKLLEELPTGGKTPLSAGLLKAYEVARAHLYKDPNISPLLILISDGRANVSMGQDRPQVEVRRVAEIIREEERIKTLVIDVEKDGFITFGLARELAFALGAEYYKIDDLKADTLVQAVREII
ncbi:putative cobaltochelatase [Desulfofundulus salinus]|uniref:Mg-protoporphyrin IX chelatase n=1 Tax=Desulfofundulus salinus TaxID=2419843 RepID=A0A494WT79_9FIRM|nr:putative cobaltochelatase [Desulfofundulus salinum]RKO66566.1 putative cobaltochelatase [Desulfofundulus salinum]